MCVCRTLFYVLCFTILLFDASLHLAHATTDACKALLFAAETHNEDILAGTPYSNGAFTYDNGAIIRAIKKNEEPTALCLVSENINIDWQEPDTLKTPLIYATEYGMQTVVAALLALNAKVNTQDKDGRSALHWVVINGDTVNSAALVAHVDLLTPAGTPNGYKDLVTISGDTALMLCAKLDRQQIATDLMSGGAEDDAHRDIQNNNGDTALMIATKAGNLDFVTLLVESNIGAGCNVNLTNKVYNETALIMAAKLGYVDIITYLINHGADMNTRSSYGKTAIDFAVSNGHTKAVLYLISRGAYYRLRGSKVISVLDYALNNK